ncbi:peptide chain release factor 1 [Thermosulfidibacter takaii ABI70S6]|uniref:Peptide chain release factor 1 n=1 Tax=Thermosulfidibacter takaii (strain DSM 17441 / JCM 13301 / NBRC 103674 / ABI70S6) TaxID=1298851 RepID=A0A0S3QS80_THET7|nr:peptide chain release factor 1 [Thermosulfidibacter takaii]BAT71159.1 peptide chain release factor 1 [Thermosulfidibacter takaii ABI70S6]
MIPVEKLQEIERRFLEIEEKLADPDIYSDYKNFKKLAKEKSDLEPIVTKFREYKEVLDRIAESKEIIDSEDDEELVELAKEELKELEEKQEQLERELKVLLLPKDPNDEKNIFLEIRAAAGGEEAALFAADLFRMYSRYAERKGWKVQILDANVTGRGGFKEIVALIEGKGAYSRLKYESGVHRVQRIPETESGGRIHTSTATVAVLPEVEEEEVEIRPEDIRIDVFRASGAGGQHVNVTDSAVRITHIPTGIVVQCQDERSQYQNREKAMRMLRAKLKEMMERQKQEEISEQRRRQVGTGERSEKIRTYNFPQNRVTDHRIGLTLYRLEDILDGDLDEIIDAIIAYDQAERLKRME